MVNLLSNKTIPAKVLTMQELICMMFKVVVTYQLRTIFNLMGFSLDVPVGLSGLVRCGLGVYDVLGGFFSVATATRSFVK